MPGIKPRDLDSDLEDYFKTGGSENGRYRAGTCSAPYLFHLTVSVAVLHGMLSYHLSKAVSTGQECVFAGGSSHGCQHTLGAVGC